MMDDVIAVSEEQFFKQISSYLTAKDCTCVQQAFKMARQAHGEQRRRSGELFFIHPLTVSYYLALYHLDAATLSAALLHDVAEDTRISINKIQNSFGAEVAQLVDGVTKLDSNGRINTIQRQLTPQELQDNTLHKLLAAMTGDVRTVIIKLFDRLHNMRTIGAMPAPKQVKKAEETLTVYAPLANRLGIWLLKSELEGYSFAVLQPQAYQAIRQRLEEIREKQKGRCEAIIQDISNCLAAANIKATVSPDPQNIYTAYQDASSKGISYSQIDDTLRLEILTDEAIDCYTALGHLHQFGRPVPGKFDDYIAVPRDNLYRSLHTTIIHPDGQHIKLRIRTRWMDKVSEIGVLAQWRYADMPVWSVEIAKRIEVLLANIHTNIHVEPQNPSAGVAGVVQDVLPQQIRVHTPRGQMIDLPQGSTPIDFAYAIHTGLGNRCQKAYVNGEFYPLNKPLQDGDRVRIVKRYSAQPHRAWLDEDLGYILTNYARSQVRRWFRRLPEDIAISQGQELLRKELHNLALPNYEHVQVATLLGYPSTQQLYYALGRAETLPTVVATRVLEDAWSVAKGRDLDTSIHSANGEVYIITSADGRLLHLCRTCNPHPGEPITGLLRKDNGVTVHRDSCHLIRPENLSGRLLKLGWSETQRRAHTVTLQIDVYDRHGLLFEITRLMYEEKINISYINTPPHERKGQTRIILSLEVVRPRQLVRILHQVQALANVISGYVLPDGPPQLKDNFLPAMMYRPE